MAVVTVNFRLVHEPPTYNYDTSFDDLDDEIFDKLAEQHADWREILEGFTKEELLVLRWAICWKRMAREKQLAPPEFNTGEISIWGLRSGRGFGKTLAAANATGLEACTVPGYYGVVSPTHDDVRYTCFEGPTGLLSVIPPELIDSHNSSLPMLKLWNGSVIRGFAGDTPERLRGPNFHWVWADEIASWKYPEEAWSNIMFALRAGVNPRLLWTGTPKPTPFVRRLQEEKRSKVVIGSTYENRDNLTEFFYENIAKYEGTKIGRQELYGEVLDPEEEGLVKRSQWRLWPKAKKLPKFEFIIYSIDPAFSEKDFDKRKQENDPTGCSVWGMVNVKVGNRTEKHIMLLDCWEDWLGLPALTDKVRKESAFTEGDADDPLL
ncbi:MAG: terminase family protein, partial [Candidatus Bipolaricaulia bacterium]